MTRPFSALKPGTGAYKRRARGRAAQTPTTCPRCGLRLRTRRGVLRCLVHGQAWWVNASSEEQG